MPNNKDMEAISALLGLGIIGSILDADGKGTPDLNGIMKKMQKDQPKGYRPENPFNIDSVAAAKKSATTAKQLYDAYVEAGFTQEQAFELVKGILTAKRN